MPNWQSIIRIPNRIHSPRPALRAGPRQSLILPGRLGLLKQALASSGPGPRARIPCPRGAILSCARPMRAGHSLPFSGPGSPLRGAMPPGPPPVGSPVGPLFALLRSVPASLGGRRRRVRRYRSRGLLPRSLRAPPAPASVPARAGQRRGRPRRRRLASPPAPPRGGACPPQALACLSRAGWHIAACPFARCARSLARRSQVETCSRSPRRPTGLRGGLRLAPLASVVARGLRLLVPAGALGKRRAFGGQD